MRLQREGQCFERRAGGRTDRNFERAQAEAFERLQQTEKSRRLDRDGVARLRNRAQRQVHGLDTAVCHDDVVRAD